MTTRRNAGLAAGTFAALLAGAAVFASLGGSAPALKAGDIDATGTITMLDGQLVVSTEACGSGSGALPVWDGSAWHCGSASGGISNVSPVDAIPFTADGAGNLGSSGISYNPTTGAITFAGALGNLTLTPNTGSTLWDLDIAGSNATFRSGRHWMNAGTALLQFTNPGTSTNAFSFYLNTVAHYGGALWGYPLTVNMAGAVGTNITNAGITVVDARSGSAGNGEMIGGDFIEEGTIDATLAPQQMYGVYGEAVCHKTGLNALTCHGIEADATGGDFNWALSTLRGGILVGESDSTSKVCLHSASTCWTAGAGAPSAGTCTSGNNGSTYTRTDGGPGSTFYSCEGGSWVAK